VLEFLREKWVIGWLGCVISTVTAIQVLRRAKLEKVKLELEVKQLRNSPEDVADRREIYERLRGVLRDITRDASATLEQIAELHSIRLDSAFRFPDEIAEGLRVLIGHVVGLNVDRKVTDAKRNRVSDAEWRDIVEREHGALTAVAQYEEQLVGTFKPYLSL
jgi:hypothetical protein